MLRHGFAWAFSLCVKTHVSGDNVSCVLGRLAPLVSEYCESVAFGYLGGGDYLALGGVAWAGVLPCVWDISAVLLTMCWVGGHLGGGAYHVLVGSLCLPCVG